MACLSIIALICGAVFGVVPAVVALAPWAIYATAILAFFLAFWPARDKNIGNRSKVLAWWGIILSIGSALVEIARFLFHF